MPPCLRCETATCGGRQAVLFVIGPGVAPVPYLEYRFSRTKKQTARKTGTRVRSAAPTAIATSSRYPHHIFRQPHRNSQRTPPPPPQPAQTTWDPPHPHRLAQDPNQTSQPENPLHPTPTQPQNPDKRDEPGPPRRLTNSATDRGGGCGKGTRGVRTYERCACACGFVPAARTWADGHRGVVGACHISRAGWRFFGWRPRGRRVSCALELRWSFAARWKKTLRIRRVFFHEAANYHVNPGRLSSNRPIRSRAAFHGAAHNQSA